MFYLVPIFDESVPSRCEQLAGFVRVPQRGDANAVVRLPLLVQLGCLPVPHVALAVRVAGHQVADNNKITINLHPVVTVKTQCK